MYFSLAKEPVNICVIDACIGVIGTDEISNMLRLREPVHMREWLEVFDVIRRFFNWDSSSTSFSNKKFRLKPVHSFQICVVLVQNLEKQELFSKFDLIFGLRKPVQGSMLAVGCSALADLWLTQGWW